MNVIMDKSEILRQIQYATFFKTLDEDETSTERQKEVLRGMINVYFRHGLTLKETSEVTNGAMKTGAANLGTTFLALMEIGKEPVEAMLIACEIEEVIKKSMENKEE